MKGAIKQAVTDMDILKCREVMFALRPHLKVETFISDVRTTLNDNRMMIFIEEEGMAVAATVFEWGFNLYRGKYIYIDDLSTLPQARKKGYASQLLDWVLKYAKDNGYNQVHLDSGANPGRYDAHRLYLNKGFNITSFHFAVTIDKS
jgi:GNAT superfamily N-acetyltransferase